MPDNGNSDGNLNVLADTVSDWTPDVWLRRKRNTEGIRHLIELSRWSYTSGLILINNGETGILVVLSSKKA